MRLWKALLGVTLAAAAIGTLRFVEADDAAAQTAPPMPAMPVPVVKVVKKNVPIHLDYSARTESIMNVTLQAKVSGYLEEQAASDGADVAKNDLLYRIDPRDFEAALDQAKAQAQRDAAALEYAGANLSRGNSLTREGWLAKDGFEQRQSTAAQAKAALAVDRANIRTAELNLSRAEIRAPFAGRLGRNQAPVGTLVSVAGTALNTLVQLDPIYVTFNPGENDLAEIQKARAARDVEVEIVAPGAESSRHKGKLTFIDNVVDRSTGTVTARATISNADFSLLPGQYVRARLHIRDAPNSLLAPQIAIGSSQLGKYVYVVGEGNKADQRMVSLGPTDGDLVVVQGVTEADLVIVGNLQKIGPGAPVQPLPQSASPAS